MIKALQDVQWMKDHYLKFITDLPSKITFVVSGSHLEGEGEHKIFQLAKRFRCRNLLVHSVDNDVYIIAFIRRHQFETIEITKDAKSFFSVTTFLNDYLKYDVQKLIYASFLFGSDFIPEFITLTPSKAISIHKLLMQIESSDMVSVLHCLVKELTDNGKIRFKRDPENILNLTPFWITCLWMLDYYKRDQDFPQKFIENRFFFMSERNSVLNFLNDYKVARYCYAEAWNQYQTIATTQHVKKSKYEVYTPEALQRIDSFLIDNVDHSHLAKITWTRFS